MKTQNVFLVSDARTNMEKRMIRNSMNKTTKKRVKKVKIRRELMEKKMKMKRTMIQLF